MATISRIRGDLQWSLKQMLFAITSLAVILSILADPWPYRLRFAISRAALERFAARAERGETLMQPERAGLFMIVKMDRRQNRCPYTQPVAAMGSQQPADPLYTCLWTGPESGFVHPAPKNRSLFNDYALDCFDEHWQFFIED
ncbi:MAG TPA: hypothetical protein VGX76_03760 [Pirellulales bacterium]|nr:hypothetical protein [Pirellulales bacterium]